MQEATKDVGNDDESSSPTSVFRSCRRRYMPSSLGVRLFREPDAGNLPVRFDEREEETAPSQTGLRWRCAKAPSITTGRLKLLRLFSTLLIAPLATSLDLLHRNE